jgi:hypothetical protein
MKTVGENMVARMGMALGAFAMVLGTARDARAAGLVNCQNTGMSKNVRSYTTRCADPATAPKQLTRKDVKRLTATAKSAEDHLTIAHYYEAEADQLDSQATGYEGAAAAYRSNPGPKNLASPTTPAHFEYLAQGFRKEAKADRALAAGQEEMAKSITSPDSRSVSASAAR